MMLQYRHTKEVHMDNNDQDKTVIVEKDTSERSTNPLGAIIAIVVILVLAVLAYNLFAGNNTATPTDTNSTAPAESSTETPAE